MNPAFISRPSMCFSLPKIEDLFIELDDFVKLFFFHGPQHDAVITFDQVRRVGLNVWRTGILCTLRSAS